MSAFVLWNQSVNFLSSWLSGLPSPTLGVVLGSGLGQVLPELAQERSIPYAEIPGFVAPSVQGHKGYLKYGLLKGLSASGKSVEKSVVVLMGRCHAYEGHSPNAVVHNVRTLMGIGVQGVLLTNASGCLVPHWSVGSPMLITDHINMTGTSPFIGLEFESKGPKFLDLVGAYDLGWQSRMRVQFALQKQTLFEGTYLGLLGPTYETPAEVRMMQGWGASAVGMSTVWECMAIRHFGGKVAAVSCLSNFAAGINVGESIDHKDVLEKGKYFSDQYASAICASLLEFH